MKKLYSLIAVLLLGAFVFAGCGTTDIADLFDTTSTTESITEAELTTQAQTAAITEASAEAPTTPSTTAADNGNSGGSVNLKNIPAYSGKPYVAINNNVPYFSKSDSTTKSFEKYSDLDSLGRCGVAFANVGADIMPTEKRGAIGSVKPSGWHTVKYDNVDGKYLYNRCHLIGYQLSGENANEKNLITGTRYLNVEGMLPFENMVADYVKETDNHVLYRVTPIFKDKNLLADGVLMEAFSVEDDGDGICFNVFCYNVQPGIKINYVTGDSSSGSAVKATTAKKAQTTQKAVQTTKKKAAATTKKATQAPKKVACDYVANVNTKKFHNPGCNSVKKMKESNKEYLHCSRDEAIANGYSPCKNCNP